MNLCPKKNKVEGSFVSKVKKTNDKALDIIFFELIKQMDIVKFCRGSEGILRQASVLLKANSGNTYTSTDIKELTIFINNTYDEIQNLDIHKYRKLPEEKMYLARNVLFMLKINRSLLRVCKGFQHSV
ncbi:MAG: hypothetical protein LBU68_01260 [Rickettsiales bacterium]|jgi:hypothetical protein|nr:hypothetical protein [Rickettsiales bacterium]